jgi:tyrosyl-tRNA synthetase
LFGGGDLSGLSASTLSAALREAGSATVSGEIPSYVDLMVETGLAKSRGDARRTIAEGGAYLNNQRVEDPDLVPTSDDLVAGAWLVLRRGKKTFAGVEVTPI